MINRELLEQTLNKAKKFSCYLAQFKDIDSNSNWLKNWLEYKFPQLTAENCYGKADLRVGAPAFYKMLMPSISAVMPLFAISLFSIEEIFGL